MNWIVSHVTQTVQLTVRSVLFCICTALFDFIKSLYIFHPGSLLSFFVLFPFSFQSSLARSTLFFLSSFLFYLFFQRFPFVSLFVMSFLLFDYYLCFSIFFLCFCSFISLRFLYFFLSLLTFFFPSFTHILFWFKTTGTESRDII